MLAAEYQTLPEAMRAIVVRFFDDNHAWLADLLEAGRTDGRGIRRDRATPPPR